MLLNEATYLCSIASYDESGLRISSETLEDDSTNTNKIIQNTFTQTSKQTDKYNNNNNNRVATH